MLLSLQVGLPDPTRVVTGQDPFGMSQALNFDADLSPEPTQVHFLLHRSTAMFVITHGSLSQMPVQTHITNKPTRSKQYIYAFITEDRIQCLQVYIILRGILLSDRDYLKGGRRFGLLERTFRHG